jgi:hypothetical protein
MAAAAMATSPEIVALFLLAVMLCNRSLNM